MDLRDMFIDVMTNYANERIASKYNKEARMFKLIKYELRDKLKSRLFDENLAVKGSCGAGGWTNYPWVAIYNTNITTSIQEGVYIVYLFSEDMQRLYLTLNQGCTNLKSSLGAIKAREEMKKVRENIRNQISSGRFSIDNNLNIGNTDYEVGSIFYKKYELDNMPLEEEFRKDLMDMVSIYTEFYNINYASGDGKLNLNNVENKKGMDMKDIIKNINRYINSLGYIYTYEDLSNFYLSLKTKPFVILAGISGTGKSKIVRLFAEAIGANVNNGRYKMISVKPDWNDSTELFGYKNINDEFIPGQLTKIIEEAVENRNMPYFVCIDEMNLARVEYYLSEYLSLIESRNVQGNEIVTDPIFSRNYVNNDYCKLYIPENLYIIGTVNMDDTTFQFSRKVLDRANTIEFSQVDLDELFLNIENTNKAILENVSNGFIKTSYLNINDVEEQYREYAASVNTKIVSINNILKRARRHFAYRVRDEIIFYMIENKKLELIDENLAFDYQIMQKILPAISGSEAVIKDILVELFNFCLGKETVFSDTSYLEDAESFLKDAVYSKSASKILDMLRGYKYDGFATYWF